MTPTARYLLISRVGPQSLHSSWMQPESGRNFDVLLSAYAPNVLDQACPGVICEYRPGPKVAGYAELFHTHADLIARYEYVALFDDDLMIEACELSRLFDIVAAHDLKIAQPALTHDSHFTYAALLRDSAFRLRYVNYIEMMCPIFRADVLKAVAPIFAMGFESGIDLIWCNLVAESPKDFAVIDDVVVRHTRAVGVSKAANGFTGARRYEDDIYSILERFGLPWLSCVPYTGIRRNGQQTSRRSAFLWSSLPLFAAIAKGPGLRHRSRSIATYWKHLLGRKALNMRISWPKDVQNGDCRAIDTEM